jgi:hypothetical protein
MSKKENMRLSYEINQIEKTAISYVYHYALIFENDSTKVRINFNLCVGLWDNKFSESLYSQVFNDELYPLTTDPQDFIKKLSILSNCNFATPLFQIRVFGERIILNNCMTIVKNPYLEDDIIYFFTDVTMKMQKHSSIGQYVLNTYTNEKYRNADETTHVFTKEQTEMVNKMFRNFNDSRYANDEYKKTYEKMMIKYGDI